MREEGQTASPSFTTAEVYGAISLKPDMNSLSLILVSPRAPLSERAMQEPSSESLPEDLPLPTDLLCTDGHVLCCA